jgi:hypothetical protein
MSPPDLIGKFPEVLVVACTSTIYPSNTTAIELPSRERTPQTKTGLHRRTWAVPAWLLLVQSDLLKDYVGHISGPTLRKLLEAVGNAQKDQP